MKVVDIISNAVTEAVEYVVEKNSIQAQQNRLKLVMRNESNLTQKAYVELGKYYYEELREKEINEKNETICETIDNSKERMTKAVERYKELMVQQDKVILKEVNEDISNADDIADDITLCCVYNDEENKEETEEEKIKEE